mmetsp:Transcript_522/g.869  ORF Transcript_522/g.869 Transcript_522/m.869 type:complete len:86 (+) Transcript_522:207-464(+)|eukprot:scaffold5989_cov210-Skeletonema_menzelii.AAC.6
MASLPTTSSLTTHFIVFLTGVVVGKSLDAEELNAYRSANETMWTKLGRQLKYFVAGSVVLGLVAKLGSTALLKNGEGKSGGGTSK